MLSSLVLWEPPKMPSVAHKQRRKRKNAIFRFRHCVHPWTQPYGQLSLCTNSSGTNLDSAAGPIGANYTDVVCKSSILTICHFQALTCLKMAAYPYAARPPLIFRGGHYNRIQERPKTLSSIPAIRVKVQRRLYAE